MKLQLIRNATLKLEYGGRTILIDPFFAARHSRPSFTWRSLNPLVDLPVHIDTILSGVELVVVSHLHADHFDPAKREAFRKIRIGDLICELRDRDRRQAGAGFSCRGQERAGGKLRDQRRETVAHDPEKCAAVFG